MPKRDPVTPKRGSKFTPKQNRKIKPMDYQQKSLYPEVRYAPDGTITMTYEAFRSIKPQSIGKAVDDAAKRREQKLKKIKT